MPTEERPFCGREEQLARLREAWGSVAGGEGPRTLVLLGESGFGKTRLVQEFYGWLAAEGQGETRYWPADLAQDGNNLYVNPPESSWDAGAPLPYLWWGIRLTDPKDHNQVVTSALASHVMPYLAPHLEPFARERRRRQRLVEVAKVGTNVALDAALDLIPVLGLLKKVGEVGFELKGIHDAWRKDQRPTSAQEFASEQRTSLVDEVIADLGKLFAGPAAHAVPAVIVIDDAQFSASDAGMVAFAGALVRAMTAGRWPVLLLVTHWQREWAAQAQDADDQTVAGVLTVAGAEHGAVELLSLGPIEDLAPLLSVKLPGLTSQQSAAILGRVGGNPRFLDEVLKLVELGGRGFFVGRDPHGPLTEAGLRELLDASTAFHELVRRRLMQSPEQVQKAVVLAGLQGGEFLAEMVAATAAGLADEPQALAEAVARAENPHAYFASTFPGFAAFVQPIYREVASQRLGYWYDPEEARLAVEEVVRERMASLEQLRDPREVVALYDLAARLFERSSDEADRRLAAHALYWLSQWAHRRREVHAMSSLSLRLAEVLLSLDDEQLASQADALRAAAMQLSQFTASQVRRALLERAERVTAGVRHGAADAGARDSQAAARHARSIADLAAFYQEQGEREAARAAWEQAVQAAVDLSHAGADAFVLEVDERLHAGYAEWLVDEGQLTAAERTFHHCLASLERLRSLDPDGSEKYVARELSNRLGLAGCAMVAGDYQRAEAELRGAVGVARQLAVAEPGPDSHSKLSGLLHRLSQAIVMAGQGPGGEAAALVREALSLARSNQEALPGVIWAMRETAAMLEASPVHDFREPDGPDLAWAHIQEALALRRQVAAEGGYGLALWDLSRCLSYATDVAYARGDLVAAGAHAAEGLELTRATAGSVGEAAGALALISTIAHAARVALATDDLAGARGLIEEAERSYPAAAAGSASMAAALMARVEQVREELVGREGAKAGDDSP